MDHDLLLALVAEAASEVAAAGSPEAAAASVLDHITQVPGVRAAILDPGPEDAAARPHEKTLDCPLAPAGSNGGGAGAPGGSGAAGSGGSGGHRLVTHGEPAIARPPVRWALEALVSLLNAALRPAGAEAPEPPALAAAWAELSALETQFVASLSHELRTPLTSIMSFADLLTESDADNLRDDQRRYLEIIARNAHRLDRLVGDLLLLAKLETGGLPLDVDSVNVAALAEAAVAGQRPAAEEAGLTVTCAVPPGAPLTGDGARLRQVLDHLVGNAVKFTPAGGHVTVTGRPDGGGWTIQVADTGAGVSEQDRARLCQPFFRGFRARERNIPTTGLGLAISRALVGAHGGQLRLDDADGTGTVVTVRLPFAGAPAASREAG
jgi:signal transduction histidine kinase